MKLSQGIIEVSDNNLRYAVVCEGFNLLATFRDLSDAEYFRDARIRECKGNRYEILTIIKE